MNELNGRISGVVIKILMKDGAIAGGFVTTDDRSDYYIPARTCLSVGIEEGQRLSFIPSQPRDGGRRLVATSVSIEQEVQS